MERISMIEFDWINQSLLKSNTDDKYPLTFDNKND